LECKYFGECGSCRIYEHGYEAQLNEKKELNKKRFQPFYNGEISVFKSPESHYRSRSEFKVWHIGEKIHYAMNHLEHKGALIIEECPQVNEHIFKIMPLLLSAIEKEEIGFKLFGADFLSSSSGEIVVSLLYHRRLDEQWQIKAAKIAHELGISLIGRSRKQKLVVGQDFVTESLHVDGRVYKFNYIENSFTQPNARVNEQMIAWALENLSNIEGDLLELYCGAGNFTIPFAQKFNKVLATEISKSSISAAKTNMALNDVHNIEFIRMSVEEFVEALDGVREFRRMGEINLDSYEMNAIFVDPPRSGMDEKSCYFASRHEHILYISCNPETLVRDLELLCKTHKVVSMALFDQFPYTHHVEMGVKLVLKD
jgi:tRNA (uracil-5-)-methyltransferase